jgi:hypothetical protein
VCGGFCATGCCGTTPIRSDPTGRSPIGSAP